MPDKERIFVAGHRGLVGSALVRGLKARGVENIITRTHAELDLTDQAEVERFFAEEKPDRVFLAAARVGGILANDRLRGQFIHENLMIQCNVLHQSMKHGVKRLVFLGSSCIYPKECPQPIKEEYLLTGPLEPTNSAYAVAKIAGVEMCHAYNKQYGTSFAPVMPTNLFGPGDNFDLAGSHVLPALIRKVHLADLAARGDLDGIARNEERWGPIPDDLRHSLGLSGDAKGGKPRLVLWGSGKPLRDFLHVDDMAGACIMVMYETETTDLLNIGSGRDVSILELAGMVKRAMNSEAEIVFDSGKPDGTMRKLLDVGRIRALGWEPELDLEQGIAKTCQWYLEQR